MIGVNSTSVAEEKKESEAAVPVVVAPSEVKELWRRLDAVDEKVEFVLGEIGLRKGLTAGTWMGFLYGILVGYVVCLFLEYILHWI